MSDLCVDVDTSIVVPLNDMPLVDDTDFKTIETALVYNSAGIKVYWHFLTTAGVYTITEIHPTTAGIHDISEPIADIGHYGIEIPASGGDHASNDTEGTGWITGTATGIYPWKGPKVTCRAAVLNNAFVDGATAPAIAGDTMTCADATAAVGDIADVQDAVDDVRSALDVYGALIPAAAPDATAIQGAAAAALTAYDPLTRTDATSDKAEIIAAVNADEVAPAGYTRVTSATYGTLLAGTVIDAYAAADTTYAAPLVPNVTVASNGSWYIDLPDGAAYTLVGRLAGKETAILTGVVVA
jgi:hypothetical protein